MSSKSASRKLSGPGADSYILIPHGGSSDSTRPRAQRPAMNFGPVVTLLTFLVLSCVIVPCHAQTSKIFQWGFTQDVSDSLPSCKNLSITVKPFNSSVTTLGVPPYYMLAFTIDGTPITSLIGTNPSSLNWQVTNPVDSKLLLTVVDSNGSSGGVPPHLFTVVAGQSTQCVVPADTKAPSFTVSANVTDTLNTCQPWGIKIKGGVPPYNVTLAAVNSPVITNVTMNPVDDQFTFIDRADPNTQLIAAVSDFNGRWAFGTPVVNTQGSSNVDCTGLVSSGGIASVIEAQEAAAAATAESRKRTATIVGVVVTLLVLLLLGGVGVFLYMRRRKMQERAKEISPRQFESGNFPETFQEAGTQILSINSFIAPSSPTGTRLQSPGPSVLSHSVSTSAPSAGGRSASTVPSPAGRSASTAPFDRRRIANVAESDYSVSSTGSGLSVRNPNLDRPAFTSFPTASVRRSAKEIEAGMHSTTSFNSEYSDGADSMSSRPLVERSQSVAPGPSGSRVPAAPARSASVGASAPPGEEIIFQHQDAGVVRELPPPYADRGRDS